MRFSDQSVQNDTIFSLINLSPDGVSLMLTSFPLQEGSLSSDSDGHSDI